MSLPVIWLPKSRTTFIKQVEYLKANWGQREINNFIERVEQAVSNISKHPTMHQVIDSKRRIHRCVVVKQVTGSA